MRLPITLERPGDRPADIVVRTAPDTRVGELARRLATGIGTPSRDPTLARRVDGRLVGISTRARLGDHVLAPGDVVAVVPAVPGDAAAVLEVGAGAERGRRIPLPPGATIVGRGADCDVVVADPHVSARHLRIDVGDDLCATDLGSVNGLTVDSVRVERARAAADLRLRIGRTPLRVELAPGRPPPGEPARPAFLRSPRAVPSFSGVTLRALPAPPATPRPGVPWAIALAPLLLGVTLAIATGRALALLTALATPVVLLGGYLVGRHRARRADARAAAAYGDALDRIDRELGAAEVVERSVRCEETPSLADALDAARARSPTLWAHRPGRPGFGTVRLGTGRLPSRSRVEAPELDRLPAPLRERTEALIRDHATLPGLPVIADLATGALGVVGAPGATDEVVSGLLAQLAALHAPGELAIAAVLPAERAGAFAWLRRLPHADPDRADIGAAPRVAADRSTAARLLAGAAELLASRGAEDGSPERAGPALVLLVVDGSPAPVAELVRLVELGREARILPIWVATERAALPAACRTVLEVGPAGTAAVWTAASGERIAPIRVETLGPAAADEHARRLAAILDLGERRTDATAPPASVALAELIGPAALEDPAAVLGRWREAAGDGSARRPLRAVVGARADGPVSIDLRADGPHALVAGTTGAGKSELLQSWILAMACESGPDRLTFLLVDYKGGAAFADCAELPHCVGLVTDLDGRLARRALESLRAELRRRERLLAEARARDLEELEGRDEPGAPPALVIVVDEFAALAREMPEFLDGVVDLAQRGRSLGIHLILATQRPAGVVRDSVRANTAIRIALRVADEAESRDVIGVPAAARIEPATPGRALLAIGTGPPIAFQAAYTAGATVVGGGPRIDVAWVGVESEQDWPPAPDAAPPVASDQRRLVAAIRAASSLAGIPPPRRPWLDALPDRIAVAELPREDGPGMPIGLSDDPARQRRILVRFDPDVDGHLVVYGAPGSGRTTALRTLALAAARPDDPVQVDVLDFAGGALADLERLPHVGSVIAPDDPERVERLLRGLAREAADRAVRFTATAFGEVAAPGSRPPRRLLLVDGYAAFREAVDVGRDSAHRIVEELVARGRRLGIHVALAVDRPSAVPAAMAAAIGRRIILRLGDEAAARLAGVPRELIDDAAPPGRGVVDGLETQLALAERSGTNESTGRRPGTAAPAFVAEPVPRLPAPLDAALLPARLGGRPVLGLSVETVEPVGLDPAGTLVVAGPPGSGRTTALLELARSLRRWDPRARLIRLAAEPSVLGAGPTWSTAADSPEDAAELVEELLAAPPDPEAPPVAVILESVAEFLRTGAEAPLGRLVRAARRSGMLVVAEEELAGWSQPSQLLADLRAARRGLLLRTDAADGATLLRTALPRGSAADATPGRAVLVERGSAIRLQLPRTSPTIRNPSTGGTLVDAAASHAD